MFSLVKSSAFFLRDAKSPDVDLENQCFVDSMTAWMQPDAEKELCQTTQALDHSLIFAVS